MKIYIVGNDGSGTEYSPSVVIKVCRQAYEGTNYFIGEDSPVSSLTKAFDSYNAAKAYFDELVDGQRSHTVVMGEIEIDFNKLNLHT